MTIRDNIDFDGDTGIVVGGASGIGREIADQFARLGGNVVVADIDTDGGEAAAADIDGQTGASARFVETDASAYADCAEMVAAARDAFGSVDAVFNCVSPRVASLSERSKPFAESDPSEWDPYWNVVLRGAANVTHAALQPMLEQESGTIVNFVSESYKGHDQHLSMYAATKAGVATLTKVVSKEVGPDGVRVNAVSPGTTKTEYTADFVDQYGDRIAEQYPMGRLGTPADQAHAALFLCSDAAAWITGQTLSVSGGYL